MPWIIGLWRVQNYVQVYSVQYSMGTGQSEECRRESGQFVPELHTGCRQQFMAYAFTESGQDLTQETQTSAFRCIGQSGCYEQPRPCFVERSCAVAPHTLYMYFVNRNKSSDTSATYN